MKLLCLGDVVGEAGLLFLCRRLPSFKRENNIDVCIVNGENADVSGTGLTRELAEELLSHGADAVTTGNHCLRRCNEEMYCEVQTVLMPANYPSLSAQAGSCLLDFGKYSVFIVNLCGNAYGMSLDNPFLKIDELLNNCSSKFKIVDFHAESTAEKKSMGYYLDGRVSAIFGTHTHVPTADEQVLPNGTGYITDVGMCGPINSVIGVEPQAAVQKQKLHRPAHFSVAKGKCALEGVIFELNESNGMCESVGRIRLCE